MPVRAVALLASLAAAGLGLTACGGSERPAVGTTTATTASGAASSAGDEPGAGRAPGAGSASAPKPPAPWTATCPTATTSPLGCRAVLGRVLSIQSYDPDGDGDLHVIAVGGDVTLPGITVFDVRPALRPDRDPVEGEYVTGAGPVFRGSLRQKQIQTDVFRVWRPGD